SLLLRRPLAGYYVLNLADPGLPFTGVIEMSSLVDRSEFQGHNLVYLPRYAAAEEAVWNLSDDEVQDQFLQGLMRIFPDVRPEDLVCFRLSRARHVFALPTLGYSRRLPPMHTSIAGLYVINSGHIVNGTLNVNETVGLANQASAWLLKETETQRLEGR